MVASDLFTARIHARAPLSAVDGGRADTCHIQIVEVAEVGGRNVVEEYDSSESLEAAIRRSL